MPTVDEWRARVEQAEGAEVLYDLACEFTEAEDKTVKVLAVELVKGALLILERAEAEQFCMVLDACVRPAWQHDVDVCSKDGCKLCVIKRRLTGCLPDDWRETVDAMRKRQEGKIPWTEATWNPVTGCTKVSPGCANCYAERMAKRLLAMGNKNYAGGFAVRCHPHMLDRPLRWRKPRHVFVNSMSDLFHEDVPDDFIAEVFGVMAVAGAQESTAGGCFQGPRDGFKKLGKPAPFYPGGKPVQMRVPLFRSGPHTFQVLTKRPERMRSLLCSGGFREAVASAAHRHAHDRRDAGYLSDCISGSDNPCAPGRSGRLWPLPNVMLGVTAEDQQRADERIDLLLDVPAAVRFVSVEPMLELVDLSLGTGWECIGCGAVGVEPRELCSDCGNHGVPTHGIDWVICGCESGPKRRPMPHDWARSLRDQCADAGVSFFCKQIAENEDGSGRIVKMPKLDGRTWSQVPSTGA
jgi:protein gp37